MQSVAAFRGQQFPLQLVHLMISASWAETFSVRTIGSKMNASQVRILIHRRGCIGAVRSGNTQCNRMVQENIMQIFNRLCGQFQPNVL
jgi:hypothetical protein